MTCGRVAVCLARTAQVYSMGGCDGEAGVVQQQVEALVLGDQVDPSGWAR